VEEDDPAFAIDPTCELVEEAGLTRELLAALAKGPLVCDGAMGTMLLASGVEARCPEEINLISPETVRNVHAAYLAAGADIIETNSFGGSRIKMSKAGLVDLTLEANLAAARIAREAAGKLALVAGSIGPTGELLEPLGGLSREDAASIFREQAEALAEGGVDLFIVETMYDLTEALAALEGIACTGLPALCTMSFDSHLRTMMGVSPIKAADELLAGGAVAVGANCSVGPEEMLKAIGDMHRAHPQAWLVAQPNAGIPVLNGAKAVYSVTPEQMAGFVPLFLELGVRVIGSCCGSTPEHTRAIVRAVRGG